MQHETNLIWRVLLPCVRRLARAYPIGAADLVELQNTVYRVFNQSNILLPGSLLGNATSLQAATQAGSGGCGSTTLAPKLACHASLTSSPADFAASLPALQATHHPLLALQRTRMSACLTCDMLQCILAACIERWKGTPLY
jgi:hypothetical protein